ncbi:MAG TPA: hypothetical protein VMB03_20385 [Bryobacteraceae bacterium]|nr:hypothetical protein [Bryobacteraceae bacterium]
MGAPRALVCLACRLPARACSEWIHGRALDASGDLDVAGATASAAFPTTSGAVQTAYPAGGSYAGFVAKVNPDGSQTAAVSAHDPGQPGHTYAFYSIALDGAGTVESVKTTAGKSTPVSATAVTPCDFGQSVASIGDGRSIVSQALRMARASDDLNADGWVNVVNGQIELNAVLGLSCRSNQDAGSPGSDDYVKW